MKQENGLDVAIQSIYRDLDYARNLIKSKAGKNSARRESVTADGADADIDDDPEEEESWTFVGADADTIDDLSIDGVMKRTVADPKASPILSGERRPLGNRVLSSSSGLGIEVRR